MIDIAVAVARVLAARWEGFRAAPYLCPAGVPTIGYGFTYYPDGTLVTLHDAPMTRDDAATLLEYLLRTRYIRAVIRLCPGIQTAEQLGAIADFCFNLGIGALKSSNLRRDINNGDWEDVPAQLRRWTHAAGKTLPGLVARRENEIQYI